MQSRYGWRPDKPDHRDFYYRKMLGTRMLPFPDHIDNRDKLPPPWNQETIGSCTGHGTVAAMMWHMDPQTQLSRLMCYFNGRHDEGTTQYDSGCEIRDVVKAAAFSGVAPEPLWPYDISKFAQTPSDEAYTVALAHCIKGYARIDNTDPQQLLECLANGDPFVFGFTVYSDFESEGVANTGIVNMPEPNETVMGGHCVLAVGYDLPSMRLICRNSWGPDWGENGHFTLPLAYATNADLATDFWHISMVGYGPSTQQGAGK